MDVIVIIIILLNGCFLLFEEQLHEKISVYNYLLSKKVHATIPKGIVGGFEFLVLLKEFHERDLCLRVPKESNKSRFDSYNVRNSVLIISHITFRDCRKHIFAENQFLEIALDPGTVPRNGLQF